LARPRLPELKAKVSGAEIKNPQRHRNRKAPDPASPIGEPPDWMGGEQRIVWKAFAAELPWLNGSHRAVLEIATTIRARLVSGEEVGVQALNLLRQCLGQMGATPADATKVTLPDGESDDPEDKFFGRTH
jgi:hypothetical protein